MYYKNQSFMVVGLSRSGVAAAKFLISRGAKVYIYDELNGEEVRKNINLLTSIGCEALTKESVFETIALTDILVLSPAVPIDSPLAMEFRRQGKRITGEAEIGLSELKCPIVAVTGTNGKTTTVSMIGDILKTAGIDNAVCGNIGIPVCSVVDKLWADSIAVVEISSFQLETIGNFKPHIAIVTNITEDHLSRHYNMENYIYLKSKIYAGQRESEFLVLCADDEIALSFAKSARAKVKLFSAKEKCDCYFSNGQIYCDGKLITDAGDIALTGEHNYLNAMAAILTAKLLGVSDNHICQALKNFKGVRHRIELIYENDGVYYYDDSKGTNVDATLKAVATMTRPTVLLLGGKDKGYDYLPLFEGIKEGNVSSVVIYGENRFKILEAAVKSGFTDINMCNGFLNAVKCAKALSQRGTNVLLSPASSSFDAFSSYEERGETFEKYVRELYDDGKE